MHTHLINDHGKGVDGNIGFISVIRLVAYTLISALLGDEDIIQKSKDRGKNLYEIRFESFSHNKTKTLPSGKKVTLKRVSGFKARILKINHHVDGEIGILLEIVILNCMGHDGKYFDQLSSDLTILFLSVSLHHLEEELHCVIIKRKEVLASSFGESTHSRNNGFFGEATRIL